MRFLLLFVGVFIINSIFGQVPPGGVLNIQSETGDKFYFFLEGVKQNEVPLTSIRLEGLLPIFYQIKLEFTEKSIEPITKGNIVVTDENDKLMDVTYKVLKNKSGGLRLKFYSMYPVRKDPSIFPGTMIVRMGEVNSKTPVEQKIPAEQTVKNQNSIDNNKVVLPVTVLENNTAPKQITISKELSAENKCKNDWPMWQADFNNAIKKITGSEKTRLSEAKALAGSNCISSEQVAKICTLLELEDSRLSFAKFSFVHLTDPGNYSRISREFTSEKSKINFNKFVSGE